MKTKYFFLAALAGMTFASCTSDDYVAEAPPSYDEGGIAPIVFSSSQSAFTRADFVGAEAAGKLGNKFVVFGYKGSETGTPGKATNGVAGSTVFDNYLVQYAENTANTTESNSDNWEYVGKGPIKHATDNGITSQTIKYWDYSQSQYDFIAWSTGSKTAIYEGTPNDGEVLVSEIQATAATSPATGLATAYTFTGTAADLSECYIADLVTVYKKEKEGTDPTYNVVWKGYQEPVTLKFRQLGTKVRIGLYETVPGYSVKNVKFYTTGDVLTNTATQIVDNATIFSAGSDIYKEGTYTVSFPTVDTPNNADNNQAHVVFTPKDAGSKTTTVDWGTTLNYTYRESGEKDNGAVYLGRSSNNATYAGTAANNYYNVYLPNEEGANLNLRVDFTLESIDGSGEIINVKNAKAQVPSIYTTWKPGYAYTYLFKISDNTNGRTGVYDPTQADGATINSDPAGLYPITFDALVVNAEEGNDNTQETITTIATPSITTYQQKSTVVNADEYTVNGKDIFVTVNTNANPGALIAMNTNAATANGAALYILPSADMTEAEVIDALAYRNVDDAATGTILGRSGKALTIAANVADKANLEANKWMLTNTVEFGANGNPIGVNANGALRFTPEAAKTYAFVYTQTAADPSKDKVIYEAIKFSDVSSYTGKRYRYAYKNTTASSDRGTPSDASDDIFDAQKGHVYFTETSGVYAKVANPFIGQGASNLFTRSGASEPYTYTKVTTDYVQTGIAYYYTTDGLHYFEAHLVLHGTTIKDVLYEYNTSTNTYTKTSDVTPVDGKAYYNKVGDVYTYCVFLPQQVNGMYELDTEAAKVETTETPVEGQTYFAKYNYDSAVRYAKVIKVQ